MKRAALMAGLVCLLGACGNEPRTPAAAPQSSVQGSEDSEQATLKWLRTALVGQWVGTAQADPRTVWNVTLDLNEDGSYALSGEPIEPDPSVLCPPPTFALPMNEQAGVRLWAPERIAQDGSAVIRASSFHELEEVLRVALSDLRLTRDGRGLTFRWASPHGEAQASPVFRLQRKSESTALPSMPGGLALATPEQIAPAAVVVEGCERTPTPDDELEDWPEGLRATVAFRSIPTGHAYPIGRYASDPDVDPRFLRADTVEGSCTVTLRDHVVSAESEAPGACKVRLFAVDESRRRKSVQWMELRAYDGNDPPELDRDAIRKLYTEELAPPPQSIVCRFREPSRTEVFFPNALTVALRQGTGIRVRGGKFVLAHPSLDGQSETVALASLRSVLSRARRYVALRPIGTGSDAAREATEISRDIATGGRGASTLPWVQLYVETSSRAQLVHIARGLSSNPLVSCVEFVPLATTGMQPVRTLLGPLPWPTPEQIAERERDTDVWNVPGPRQPPGHRPPRRRPPTPKAR